MTQHYPHEVEVQPDGTKAQGTPATGYGAADKTSPLTPMHFERRVPGPSDVQIEILYCGVCHSDLHQVRDDWENTVWPCIPGHEIVGRVSAVGAEVTRFKVGDLAGVGCMVDSCQHCDSCKKGEEQYCENGWLATYNGPFKPDGSNTFGGYSDHIVVTEGFVLRIPDNLDLKGVAPILCAGVTTYSPMKHWGVKVGMKVGVVALGGLGHMAVQIASALGADVTIFTTRPEKAKDAGHLGAKASVVSTDEDAMKALKGSLDFILDTIPVGHDVNPYLQCLKRDGQMVLVGALEKLEPPNNMLMATQRVGIAGSLIGSLAETQEVLDLCGQHGITAQVELIDIQDINGAFERMLGEEIHYRAVIDMASLKKDRNAAD